MQLPSIHIPKRCFQPCLSPTHKSRNTDIASFLLVICPAQSIFLLGVASIPAAQWHSRFVAKLNLPSKLKRAVSITQLVIFRKALAMLIDRAPLLGWDNPITYSHPFSFQRTPH